MVHARSYVDCPAGYWMYKCAAINLETCCSVDACQLGGCPVDARPVSALGQQWGAIASSPSTTAPIADPSPTQSGGAHIIPSLEEAEAHTTETKWVTIPSTTLTAWVTTTEWTPPAPTDAMAGAAPIPPSQRASPSPLAVSNGAQSLQPGVVAGISVGLAIGFVVFAVLTCVLYRGRSDEEHGKRNGMANSQGTKFHIGSEECSLSANVWPQISSRPEIHRKLAGSTRSKRLVKNKPRIVVERTLLQKMEQPLDVNALTARNDQVLLSPVAMFGKNRMSRSLSISDRPAVSPVSSRSNTNSAQLSPFDPPPLKPEFELAAISPIRPGYAELESPSMPFFKLSPPPRWSDRPSVSTRSSYAVSPSSCYSSAAPSPALGASPLEQPRATLSPTAAERAWKIPVTSWSTYNG